VSKDRGFSARGALVIAPQDANVLRIEIIAGPEVIAQSPTADLAVTHTDCARKIAGRLS
jgi:hypothetical protein